MEGISSRRKSKQDGGLRGSGRSGESVSVDGVDRSLGGLRVEREIGVRL